jgi:hypothetical protein
MKLRARLRKLPSLTGKCPNACLQVMEFSVNMISSGGQKLRDLERAAKLQKSAIWTNYVPAPSNQGKLSDTFVGKVCYPIKFML